MYLGPWVESFNSPCAFSIPYAFSSLTLSDLLFICPSDALHCLHAGRLPLYIIHLCFHSFSHTCSSFLLHPSNFTTTHEEDA